jgi:hypothetical protein
MTIKKLNEMKAELRDQCPEFDDFNAQEILDWAAKACDASLVWSDTFVNGLGETFVNEESANWSFGWKFGVIGFDAFKKDQEDRAKKAAAMFIWLWLVHNVPAMYAEKCAEAYAHNYTFYR